jgi:hypothetical protein
MPNKTLLSQLMELAQSPVSFSSSVLGHTQASIGKQNIKNTKFSGKVAYENEEISKVDQARSMLKTLLADGDFDRQLVLNQLMKHLGITEETATSYFQRIAKEMGLTGGSDKDDDGGMSAGPAAEEDSMKAQDNSLNQPQGNSQEMPPEEKDPANLPPPEGTTTSEDPDKQGAIRVIDHARLIYKRQNEEGTYDELWIYNIQSTVSDELDVRRDILAGTDISARRQTSDDGQQSYRLTTMGNAQILEITGLPQ